MLGVVLPEASNLQRFAHCRATQRADHSDERIILAAVTALIGQQFGHGVAVLLVLIGDALDHPFDDFGNRHI